VHRVHNARKQTPSVLARTADVQYQPSEGIHYPLILIGCGSQVRPEHRPFALEHDVQILQGRSKSDGLLSRSMRDFTIP